MPLIDRLLLDERPDDLDRPGPIAEIGRLTDRCSGYRIDSYQRALGIGTGGRVVVRVAPSSLKETSSRAPRGDGLRERRR
jgi:hypothetical protein